MNIGLVAERLDNPKYIRCFNNLASSLYSPVGFINEFVKYQEWPRFAILPQKETFIYDGPLIAIDFSSAKLILNRFRTGKNFYFLDDLWWTKIEGLSYNSISDVFLNNDLEILVKTEEEAKTILNVWGRKVIPIREFEFDTIKTIIDRC